ncbi:hypothetical protein SDC9_183851 [bioreactor metagenome]|uniref:Uncharacterized protein n=1 Tax=bioreactor metagenome TaxID=1076179 RepID=A0A645HD97_9ZZZZ
MAVILIKTLGDLDRPGDGGVITALRKGCTKVFDIDGLKKIC